MADALRDNMNRARCSFFLMAAWLLFSCALPVRWGTAPVEGIVTDKASGKPLESVLVLVYFSSIYPGGSARHTQGHAYTDAEGRYRIKPNPSTELGTPGERPSILFAHRDYRLTGLLVRDRKETYIANVALDALPTEQRRSDRAASMCYSARLQAEPCGRLKRHLSEVD